MTFSSSQLNPHRTFKRIRKALKLLGPGLITGAADDDPSGIATYAQTGAQFGISMLWTMVFTYPLMCAVQIMSARLGRVTGHGIAGNLRKHYPSWLLHSIVSLLVTANIINLGADIGSMAGALELLIGGSALLHCVFFALLSLLCQVFIPYTTYVRYLKWLTISLFAYVGTVLSVQVPWSEVIASLVMPRLSGHADSLKLLVAILGTTISPYLFFWQASQEAEEVECNPKAKPLLESGTRARHEFERIKVDTNIGMGFSNVIAIFIMITTAVTLHLKGVTQIETAAQAAEALRPIAGKFCFLLFSAGIIATGLLAVPVLAGSASYAVGEALEWPVGLERKPKEAKAFYAFVAGSTLLGLCMNFIHLDPIRALIWAAVINGVAAVPILALMTHLSSDTKVLGKFTISRTLKILGWLTTAIMALAAVGMIVTGG